MNGREIKFRVWDGERIEKPNDAAQCLYALSPSGVLLRFGEPVEDERHEVMRYTGLTDARGQEIYEGDVVEHPQGRSTVRWAKPSACWAVGGSYFLGRAVGKDFVRVIGNIYENPELLEGE